MFLETYQQELAHLREVGRIFGERHPSVAGMLAQRAHDPDVERLLEGFAFVAAGLHERLDRAAPELFEGIAALLFPHLLRPTPPCTIVQFQPAPRALRGRRRIARGARLRSRLREGERCTFTTTRPIEVLPLILRDVALDDTVAAHPEITLRFALEPGTETSVFTREGIQLHLHGDPSLTSQLHLWLGRHLVGVRVRTEGREPIELGPGALRPSGLEDDDALLPWPELVSHGVRHVFEYFTFPAKLAFFDLTQLDRAAVLAAEHFEVVLRFARPPRLPARLPRDAVRLHCVPAVNLFDADAVPVRVDLTERPVILRADACDPAHMEVFDVGTVVGATKHGVRRVYASAQDFDRHAALGEAPACYRVRRRRSSIDEGIDTFIQLHRASARALDEEILSIGLRCSNRSLAQGLPIGELTTATTDVGSGLSFTNIVPATSPRRPILGDGVLSQLLAHLRAAHAACSQREPLCAFLAQHLRCDGEPPPTDRARGAQIEAITAVSRETTARIVAAIMTRGTHHRIDLDRRGFASEGEAYLFAEMLARLVHAQAPINTFADLTVCLQPGGTGGHTWRFDASP